MFLECGLFNRICASINFYNEIDCLKQALDSLKNFPLVICVDGKWSRLKDPKANKEGLSYDGSRELIKSYPNTLLLDCGNKNEEAMSNLCLRTAAVYGYPYLLQIASDEFVKGDYMEFQQNCDKMIKERPNDKTYYVKFEVIHITPEEQKYQHVQRLHHDPMFIRLREVHWQYYFDDKLVYTEQRPDFIRPIKGITIYHDDSPRNKEREKQMWDYQTINVPRERKIIMENILKSEERIEIGDINILKMYLSNNEIDWFMTNDNKAVYLVKGELSNDTKTRIVKKFKCQAWKIKEGFAILPTYQSERFLKCPECKGESVKLLSSGKTKTCENCFGLGKI